MGEDCLNGVLLSRAKATAKLRFDRPARKPLVLNLDVDRALPQKSDELVQTARGRAMWRSSSSPHEMTRGLSNVGNCIACAL
jgi:hypothetical protein